MNKFFVYTFGCKINQYESQIIREKFESQNFIYVDDYKLADTVIINSCSVTAHADKQCEQFVNKVHRLNPKTQIILTGCYAKVSQEEILLKSPFITIRSKEHFLGDIKQEIKTFDNHSRAFVKIQDGCNNFCSYCIVPYARNNMWSKPCGDIIDEINRLTEHGFAEIVLTGIHIGKYDKGVGFLLKEIFKNINKDFRIRLSSIELNEVTDEIIDIMQQEPERMCRHLHIPLQSASDAVLKEMNRHYTASDFQKKIDVLKNKFSDIALTTDVICGFPTETDGNFEETYNFMDKNKFSRLHVFPYSRRPKTKAYLLKDVFKNGTIKERTDRLLELGTKLKKEYESQFLNTTRKAVSLRGDKAITDNYITVLNVPKHTGIFDVCIKEIE